jgi:acetyl-CoA carboxylase carboxyl transferase subunit beta
VSPQNGEWRLFILPFVKFLHKPQNELEKGGRQAAPLAADENEPASACPNCRKMIPLSQIWGNNHSCTSCGHHFRMNARQRINFITDNGSFEEHDASMVSTDLLNFPGYKQKLETTKKSGGENEAVICGTALIDGQRCCLFVMEPYFMMGSMGTVVGEKITPPVRVRLGAQPACMGYTVSGGARMQEGILSLMQMAKTSGAVKKHSEAGLFYLAWLTDPTTGGVTASFAFEGDIILSEPGAVIGFAGARVIEQTQRKKLPEGFQTAEFFA